MSDLVALRHPKLDPAQVIHIPRRQIGPRLASGWEEVAPEPAAPERTQPPPAAPRRRRRTSSEDEN